MAISTNGTVLARVAGALYNTQMSNATYEEVKTLDPSSLANALYARDFSSATDATVATTLVTNLGLTSVVGLTNWVAAQLTAAGSAKGAKIVELLNGFAQMTADATYGAAATAFNTKVDASLALSQTVGNKGGTFAAAGVAVPATNATFTLTTGLDNVAGGAGDDSINGFVSATSGVSTLTGGDQINGGAGNDALNITIDSNMTANTMTPALSGVESIVVRNLSAGANVDELSLVQATGVTSVALNNSLTGGNISVTNAPISAVYSVTNTPADTNSAAGILVTVSAADVTGTADTVKFSVQGAGSKIGNAAANTSTVNVGNTAGVEAVSVATTGTNYITADGGGTDTKTVSITGSGTNEIALGSDLNATLTLDASTSTGSNVFALAANVTSSDVIKGGTGADTLSVTLGTATGVSVTGVEKLVIEQGSTNNANLGFAANPAFTTIEVRDSDTSETSILTGITAGTTIAFVGADTTTSSLTYTKGLATNDTTFGTVQLNTAMAGTADTLAVTLGNQGVTATGAYEAKVKGSGIENVTFAQSDISSSATSTLTLTDNGLKTVAVTSAGNVALTLDTRLSSVPNSTLTTASTDSGNTITLVDFSGVTGTSALTLSQTKGAFAAAAELRTAVGGMTVTFGEEVGTDVITVTGNAGVDNVTTGSKGSFVANLGAGNDVFTANAIAVAGDGTAVVNGGDGDDNITGGFNADNLTGGAGTDTLTGKKGADILNGGAGSDTYVLAGGAAAASGTNQVTTLTPINLDNTDYINVTIGGNTYSTIFNTNLATTLGDFVTANAQAIRGATGGATNGVIVTANATQLIFTATGTNTTTDGVMTSTGYTFTAPTASITLSANAGNKAGDVVTNVFNSYVVTPNADFNAANDTFAVAVGTTSKTVTFIDGAGNAAADLAESLNVFAAANPTIGGYNVVATATTLVLYQTSANTATATATAPTSAAGTGASAGTIGAATDLSAADGVSGISAALPAASDSSYLSTGSGASLVITSTIDQITYEQGDVIDFASAVTVPGTAVTADANKAGISTTGIATFNSTPGTLADALTLIAAGIHASGTATNAGEAALFQFGGKTYVYLSDAAQGHSAADVVVEIVGAPSTLVSGLTINGSGDIIAIA